MFAGRYASRRASESKALKTLFFYRLAATGHRSAEDFLVDLSSFL